MISSRILLINISINAQVIIEILVLSLAKNGVIFRYKTRRLAACTQAVVILRSTSYIAIELNVLHFKSYEIQSN